MLQLIPVKGWGNKEIASYLKIAPETIREYLKAQLKSSVAARDGKRP